MWVVIEPKVIITFAHVISFSVRQEVHQPELLVKILRSLWLLGHRPLADDNALVEAVAYQSLRHIDKFKPTAIAAAIHSLAMLKVKTGVS